MRGFVTALIALGKVVRIFVRVFMIAFLFFVIVNAIGVVNWTLVETLRYSAQVAMGSFVGGVVIVCFWVVTGKV